MKKSLIIILLGVLAMGSYAQDDCTPAKLEAGFEAGINYSFLESAEGIPSPHYIANSAGFQFALNLEWHLLKFLSIQPALGISINNAAVTNEPNYWYNYQSSYDVFPVALEGAIKARYYPVQGTKKPYLTAGLLYMYPLEKTYVSNHFDNAATFAIDLGIGIKNRFFGKFNVSPEIRYSFGLSNVNLNPGFKELNYNRIAVVIGFQ